MIVGATLESDGSGPAVTMINVVDTHVRIQYIQKKEMKKTMLEEHPTII